MSQIPLPPALPPAVPPALSLQLPSDLRHRLDDLADATGRLPEDIVVDAVEQLLARESAAVRGVAELLAGAHAELLRRLGE
ncbi:hypothetical protein ABZT17_14190 [Streptomyces sp. NPDC005648]|uniref:hypothetical protein n=1 Tax=Streptomyces sp. NPDC005648 TaxID=3157044 RepID=UPI0033A926C6